MERSRSWRDVASPGPNRLEMRRSVGRIGRLVLAAALAYLTVGIVWTTAFGLAMAASATGTEISFGGADLIPWLVRPSVGALAVEHERLDTRRIADRDRSPRRDDGADVRSADALGARRRCAYRTPATTPTTISAA